MIAKVGTRHVKRADEPGRSFEEKPSNVTYAKNTAPKPIETELRVPASASRFQALRRRASAPSEAPDPMVYVAQHSLNGASPASPSRFLARDLVRVARELLGKVLVRREEHGSRRLGSLK